MKITVNLSKAELDLIEEALLQYQNLLLKSKDQDEMVNDELKLARRVLEEFGMEGLEEEVQGGQQHSMEKALPMPSGSSHFPTPTPHSQYASPNQYHGPNTFVAPNQYPFSR
ncbi:hypothetical protein [Thermoactinomyces mirandus]|uniref:Uncharacterized protein n=1 Tax=Thermoactinomyces mirandus TaxID=2756294 RepID=A0A7W1XQ98_9BACL|nr:hypothetical protein [Thermoactinomyces mirandus]MBA4601314.1 hypothetical protein [Thermoactinomyces mirandus]